MSEKQPIYEKPRLKIIDSIQSPYGLISKYEADYCNNKFVFYANPFIMEEDKPDYFAHAQKYIETHTISRLPGFQKEYIDRETTLEQELADRSSLFLSELNQKLPHTELRDHTLYPIILQSVLGDLFSTYKRLSSK